MTSRPMKQAPATTLKSARFRAVIGMTLVIMIGFGVVVPALPKFVHQFGRGEAGVGIVVFSFALTRLFGDFVAGGLIDRLGERTVTSLGAGIVGISSLTAGASRSFLELVVFRGLGGIGSAFFLGGLMAYLIGTTPADERGRAMGVFQGSVGIGFFVGPALGGVLLAVSHRPNLGFYVYGVVCLLCVPLAMRALGTERIPASALADAPALALGEQAAPAPSKRSWGALRPLLRSRAYRAALAGSALTFLVSQAEFTLVPNYWSDHLHASSAGSGLPFAASALFGLLIIFHAGIVTDRYGRKPALVWGMAGLAIGNAAIGFITHSWMLIAFMAFTGAAGGYTRPGPSAIVGDVSDADTRGIAVSGYRIAGDVGAIIGPLMAGFIAQYFSFRAAWIAIGLCAVLALAVAVVAEETAPAKAA